MRKKIDCEVVLVHIIQQMACASVSHSWGGGARAPDAGKVQPLAHTSPAKWAPAHRPSPAVAGSRMFPNTPPRP